MTKGGDLPLNNCWRLIFRLIHCFISCIGQSSKAQVFDNKIACGEHASILPIKGSSLCIRRRRFVFGLLQQAFAQRQKLVAPPLIFLC